ncbi:DUF2219 family protein [Rhodobacterales bacterium HKCCSP123]|nr:DUF2219 family protein [Rhodobacterales bacterium HKCCSP123]
MVRFLPLVGATLVSLFSLVPSVRAEDGRITLGTVRLFSNDTIADREDRWRSGGYGVSAFRGETWTGRLPSQPFEIMEYRFRGEVIAPDNLNNPDPADRLYAGTWWLGAHTHFDWLNFEVTAGADIAVTGEQSGLRRLQAHVHDLLSMPRMSIGDHQVADGIHLHGTLEIARSLRWEGGEFRPFVELQAGVETMARIGFDVTIGALADGGLRTRDPITGQRPEGVTGGTEGGWSFLLGADIAAVESSIFLPADRGYQAEDRRHRLRAGVNYGFGESNIFYGVTYLSEEFLGQPEGQVVGSLSLGIHF